MHLHAHNRSKTWLIANKEESSVESFYKGLEFFNIKRDDN